ncbi:universal stress protein [Paenibacillus agricola]|uniref:Universal stress protein n=1 Tax=Paenibacillus agricola TaxID=2716264 RepID=A0ABX0JD95_9BACL|nr:universal stress protein [Paenibacillus agricola]NHN33226.1 universal stress protein [Paenibacillus agricola]
MYQNILLAADGSAHSFRAAEQAIHLAKGNPEAKVVILYVVDSETSKSDVLRNLDTKVIDERRLEKMGTIEKVARESGINYEIKIIHGDPGPSIVAYANDNKFDVILIGSRGLNALQEFVLGSVSHKVAKRANCPVMIVK